MTALFYEEGGFRVVCDYVCNSACFENPHLDGPEGVEVPARVTENLALLTKTLTRHNYLEVIDSFIEYGLENNGTFLSGIYVGKGTDAIYGVTIDGKTIELLTHKKRVDLFTVVDAPSSSVLSTYEGLYSSSSKLNLRDCIGYYPLKMDTEARKHFESEEASLSFYSYLNDWVNNRQVVQEINFGLTIDDMLKAINVAIDWKKLFGALYYNKEGYTEASEIPLIQQKVIRSVDPKYLPYYIYLMNLVLHHQDDSQTRSMLYHVRYMLAHFMG